MTVQHLQHIFLQKGIKSSSGSRFSSFFFFSIGLIFWDTSIGEIGFSLFSFNLKKILESSCPVILNNANYFQWLPHMIDLIRSKNIYRIATGQETKPTDGDKASKWENKKYQPLGLREMSIAQGLLFHILEIDTPDATGRKINLFLEFKMKSGPNRLKMIFLLWTPIISPLLKIFCPNSRPLDFF